MELYIVYLHTMENSPEVRIIGATADKKKANEMYWDTYREANEWMSTRDEDSGSWASAHKKTFDMNEGLKPGDTVYVTIETLWHEIIKTTLTPYIHESTAKRHIEFLRQDMLKTSPGLTPYDGEPDEGAMHFEDPSVMVDVYFGIEPITIV